MAEGDLWWFRDLVLAPSREGGLEAGSELATWVVARLLMGHELLGPGLVERETRGQTMVPSLRAAPYTTSSR